MRAAAILVSMVVLLAPIPTVAAQSVGETPAFNAGPCATDYGGDQLKDTGNYVQNVGNSPTSALSHTEDYAWATVSNTVGFVVCTLY